MKRILLDTNLYVDWLNAGRRAELFVGGGHVRYLSAVVHMELRAGATTLRARRALAGLAAAYSRSDRLVAPEPAVFERAGSVLRLLRARGREVRRASLVNDVLIALSARSLGATVCTADAAFAAIREVEDFALERVD